MRGRPRRKQATVSLGALQQPDCQPIPVQLSAEVPKTERPKGQKAVQQCYKRLLDGHTLTPEGHPTATDSQAHHPRGEHQQSCPARGRVEVGRLTKTDAEQDTP